MIRPQCIISNQSVPVLSGYNMRSLPPKLNNFVLDFSMRQLDVAMLTEIWQVDSMENMEQIEELPELNGIDFIFNSRGGGKRGGGIAIATNKMSYVTSKLSFQIPKALEIIWASTYPKCNPKSKTILCCFYSPPKSGKNHELVDHISDTIQSLLVKDPFSQILIFGDRNLIQMESLNAIDPCLRQIVTKPTRGKNILDVILTNIHEKYFQPLIIDAILPDNTCHGVPSDHKGVIIHPNISNVKRIRSPPKKIWIRPIPE